MWRSAMQLAAKPCMMTPIANGPNTAAIAERSPLFYRARVGALYVPPHELYPFALTCVRGSAVIRLRPQPRPRHFFLERLRPLSVSPVLRYDYLGQILGVADDGKLF